MREGDIVGRIDYRLGSESLAQVDITAAGDVEAITFQSAFLYLLGGFLGL